MKKEGDERTDIALTDVKVGVIFSRNMLKDVDTQSDTSVTPEEKLEALVTKEKAKESDASLRQTQSAS